MLPERLCLIEVQSLMKALEIFNLVELPDLAIAQNFVEDQCLMKASCLGRVSDPAKIVSLVEDPGLIKASILVEVPDLMIAHSLIVVEMPNPAIARRLVKDLGRIKASILVEVLDSAIS